MIKIKYYQLQSQIGNGKYSKVYKSKNLQTEETVAIKKTQKKFLFQNEINKELLSQEMYCIKLLKKLQSEKQNENLAQFIEFIESPSNYYQVMEFCNGKQIVQYNNKIFLGTDLKQLLEKHGHFSESKSITIFKQLLNGYKLLEQNKIMHRDLKTANIFLHNNVAKIGDFGFACQAENETLKLGTPLYMAPELLKGEKYDNKVDVWALGIIFYQLLFGIFPFFFN